MTDRSSSEINSSKTKFFKRAKSVTKSGSPSETAILSHKYFQGHHCSLPPDKLTNLTIKCSRWRKACLDFITVQTGDARARNMFKSYASFCEEKFRQYKYHPLAIHPFSKLRLWLDIVFSVCILMGHTMLAAHFSEEYVDRAGLNIVDSHDIVLHATEIATLCDILSKFFTGYTEGYTYRHVVLDPLKICWKYARTWLILDLAAAVSYAPHLFELTVIPYVYLSVLKILRIPILFHYLRNINEALRSGVFFKTCLEIFTCLYLYLVWSVFFQFSTEYVAINAWYPDKPRNCSWITGANLWDAPTINRFAYSFYRAVGMLRKNSNLRFVQYGCNLELFYMISWIIAKLLILHCGLKYFIAVYGLESPACKYFKIRRQVEMYMKQRKFPPRIKEKILKFYAIRYQTTFFVEERILPCVSGQLREDIIMHTGRQLVRELEFMKNLPKTLLLQISFQLKLVIFIAGDIIYKVNNVGDCMYFIHKGTVAEYTESGQEIGHLEDGDFFGETALVMSHPFRTTSTVAVSNCELFMLDREDFNSSIACYPTVYEHMKEVATRRYERTCVLEERHKNEMRN